MVFDVTPSSLCFGWEKKDAYTIYARHLVTHGAQAWPEAKTIHLLDQAALRSARTTSTLVPTRLPDNWVCAELESQPSD
jgi:hypothetical protein